MEIVQAHNLQGKTVGVFTMVDEVMPGRKWEMFKERLLNPNEVNNGGVPVEPHGWVPVVNAAVMGPTSNIGKLAIQARNEEEFLQAKMPELVAAGKAGCGALVRKLQALIFDFLREEWAPTTVRMLEETCEPTLLQSAVLGMPAFHETWTEEQAMEGAVTEARRRLTDKSATLIDECCTSVLGPFKLEVKQVFDSNPCNNIAAGTLPGFLREHQEKVDSKCQEFVKKWGEYWVGAVRSVLESRTPPPPAGCAQEITKKRIAEPQFELDRFPAFIEAILCELETLLQSAQATLRKKIVLCFTTFYSEMSPGVRLSSNFQPPLFGVGAPPMVTVTFDSTMLIESVVLAFVKEGDVMICEELCTSLDRVAVCAKLQRGHKAWVENCDVERVMLLTKLEELRRAQGEILQTVFGVGSIKEMECQLPVCGIGLVLKLGEDQVNWRINATGEGGSAQNNYVFQQLGVGPHWVIRIDGHELASKDLQQVNTIMMGLKGSVAQLTVLPSNLAAIHTTQQYAHAHRVIAVRRQ